MRVTREQIRENTYRSKELCVGYQILVLRSQNETCKKFLSPACPNLLIDAIDDGQGLKSSLELHLGDDMTLELHRKGTLEIPALVNGKPWAQDTRQLDHGSVLQLGDEILKVRKIQTQVGAQGQATQRVYTSERRRLNRKAALREWVRMQGLWMLLIVATALFLGALYQ
jgi:hypothetical protein